MGRHKKVGAKKRLTEKQYQQNQAICRNNYRKRKLKCVNLTFNIDKDKDILDWLEEQTSKQKSIKTCLREYINKGNL